MKISPLNYIKHVKCIIFLVVFLLCSSFVYSENLDPLPKPCLSPSLYGKNVFGTTFDLLANLEYQNSVIHGALKW